MKINNLIIIGALAIGGYILYKYFTSGEGFSFGGGGGGSGDGGGGGSANTFKEAAKTTGGIANKVMTMMSKSFPNVTQTDTGIFKVTIPPKIDISKGPYSSFKVASVVSGGIAHKVIAMSSLQTPKLITSIKTGEGRGRSAAAKVTSMMTPVKNQGVLIPLIRK